MICLLGANGYVGARFHAYLQNQSLDVKVLSRAEVDYNKTAELRDFLKELRPDFLINAAGFTGKPNVDACEAAKAETLQGNTVLPLRLAEVCADLGIAWGHVSSGCIYQGARETAKDGTLLGFREDDEPNFSFRTGDASFYSGTKALAEAFLASFPNVYCWRLRVPFDARDSSRNYLSKLLRYDQLLDVRNSLSHLDDFVAACWATRKNSLPFGIYNLTNPGSVTTCEVVEMIQNEGARRAAVGDDFFAQRFGKKFHWFGSEAEFRKIARAPRSSCVLDTTKAEQYHLPLRPVRTALREALENWTWERKT